MATADHAPFRTTRRRLIITDALKPTLQPYVYFRQDSLRKVWVVLAPEHVYWPDETSIAILQKLDGARNVACIIDDLARDYGAPRAAVAADVVEFLQTWADERLIREAEQP
ncbi:MAG: pyrroloquinoline quinone biosynthesis peptide chaperone PqqD [Rhizobiales bacterium]|nr:pyrroloquinoline quinone biosynthesis peptide chaperone PqqD [Hyphomicrobiales bacterium]